MPLSLSLYTTGNTCCMECVPLSRGCSRAAHRVTDEQTKDFLIVCPSGHERFFRWIGTFHSSLRSWYPLRGNYSQSNSCGAGFSIFRISIWFYLENSLWEKFSAITISFYFQCDSFREECKIVQDIVFCI